MQFRSTLFLIFCALSYVASQSFSYSFGLDDSESSFSFPKLKSPSHSTSNLNDNARTPARGASRMASGNNRLRQQDIPETPITTRSFTTVAPATRISTRDLFTVKVSTPTPVPTRKPNSGSARNSGSTQAEKKKRVNSHSVSSFSFSGLEDQAEIERAPQSKIRNGARIPTSAITNTERVSQSSIRNSERLPQRLIQEAERPPQTISVRTPQHFSQNSERPPQTVTVRTPQQFSQNSERPPQTVTVRTPQQFSQNSERPSQTVTVRTPQQFSQNSERPPQAAVRNSETQKMRNVKHSAVKNTARASQSPTTNTKIITGNPLPPAESQKANEIELGRSPCARGAEGHECRMQLLQTALTCTSGKCHQCQQCGSISPDEWVPCCRDHFLCCRSLARSCQRCDHPMLTPFCKVAFGKCN